MAPETDRFLRGEVRTISYSDEDSGFTIARIKTKEHPGLTTVVGILGSLAPGEMLELTGTWTEHPKFGPQFKVETCVQLLPATVNGIRRYLGSGMIKGLGPVMAGRMLEAFGAEVLTILDETPERLLQVEGIGPKKIQSIRESWEKHREVRGLMLFLQSHAIPPTFAGQIHQLYGSQAVDLLRDNPYQLAYDIRGIGFKTADVMALKLGLDRTSPRRLEAGLYYALTRETENGHMFQEKRSLLARAAEMLEIDDHEPLNEALERLKDRRKVTILPLPEQDIDEAVYLSFFYLLEREITERLHAVATHASWLDPQKLDRAVSEAEHRARIRLSPEQRRAVLEACGHKVYVITGGPGTGKTTITRMIVDTLRDLGLSVALAAPTGRAAKRLAEATGQTASTIHRLLGFNAKQGFEQNEARKLKADVLIVDEASMVDCPLFLHLLRALPLPCRLVLVGDMHQLPSVGPGNVLGDIISSAVLPGVTLTRIFRQAQNSMIVVNAHLINEGKFPLPCDREPPDADFFWIENPDTDKVQELIVRMVAERIPQVYGLDPLKDVQVLTPMHKGDVGTLVLNRVLQDRLNPDGREFQRGPRRFRVGDRVLQTRNNYDKEVFNGDLGRVIDVDPEEQRIVVAFDDLEAVYETEDLDEIVLAYAVSVHKSQGSEYPAVVMPVVTQHYMLLKRNLIYTALTRARRLAVLIGTKKALAIGLRNTEGANRNTHLRYRLQDAFNAQT
ncbi:MAG: ATP-dependent RecD-like DNA helicase [Deltaproteobacteria bacterium]|nr:ATP-dependent RecD-like DNA helicase [Deltaproteobacteria bacterium]